MTFIADRVRQSARSPLMMFIGFLCFWLVCVPVWSVEASSEPVPIVTELLLGGWLDGGWVYADTIASSVPAGKIYHTYSFAGQQKDLVGDAPTVEEGADDYWNIGFTGDDGCGDETIKIGSTGQGMPRRPQLQTGGFKPYEDVVASYLKKNGIAAKPDIRQLVRVDLDGDGSEEVIVVATNAYANIPEKVKDTYSLVLFRRIHQGKVITSAIHEHYYHEDIEGEADSPSAYRVAFVVDINNDGVLELILEGRYYEGFWYEVHDFKSGELEKVLTDGRGA